MGLGIPTKRRLGVVSHSIGVRAAPMMPLIEVFGGKISGAGKRRRQPSGDGQDRDLQT
jgi:hypothetical protein